MVTRRRLVQGLAAIAAGVWCGISRPAHAHTFVVQEVTCPVDGKKFKVNATASYTTFGGYRDFAKRGAIGSLYSDMVVACPACHFAGYPDDFGKPVAATMKAWVLGTLAKKYGTRRLGEAEECEAAAARYKFEGAKNEAIADLHLVASYILRGRRARARRNARGTSGRRRRITSRRSPRGRSRRIRGRRSRTSWASCCGGPQGRDRAV